MVKGQLQKKIWGPKAPPVPPVSTGFYFRLSSIVFEKPGILSEKLKTLTSSNYPKFQYFLLKLRIRFLLTNVYKSVLGFFFILFRSWVVTEAAARRCSVKNVFLESIQENTCSRVYFLIKLQTSGLQFC